LRLDQARPALDARGSDRDTDRCRRPLTAGWLTGKLNGLRVPKRVIDRVSRVNVDQGPRAARGMRAMSYSVARTTVGDVHEYLENLGSVCARNGTHLGRI